MFRFALAALAAALLSTATPSLAADVSAYGRLPAISEVVLSPDGARLAYLSAVGEQRHLMVLQLPNKTALDVNVGSTKIRSLEWAGDDHLLIAFSNTQAETFDYYQGEIGQILSVNVNTQKSTPMLNNGHQGDRGVSGPYGVSVSGQKSYGYFSRGVNLFKIDLDTGEDTLVRGDHIADSGWLIDADGKLVAHTTYESAVGSASWELFADTPTYQHLTKVADPLGRASIISMGRTRNTIIVAYNGQWEEWSLADGTHQALPGVDGRPVAYVLTDRKTRLAIGVVLSRTHEVLFYDAKLEARYRAMQKAFGRPINLIDWSADLNRIVIETDGKGDSGTYWLIDGGQAKIIDNPYPDVTPDAVGESREISYRASDGLEIHGVLTLPAGRAAHALPVVVLPHGGPEAFDNVGFDWWAQAYVAQGYAVFQPNYRGSSGYGDAFRDAGYGEWGRKMQTDITDGLADLASKSIIDPKRACIVGGSYGGYAALAGVTVQQGFYKCAVSVAGVADLNAMLDLDYQRDGGEPTDATRYWRKFMGAKGNGDPALHVLSPVRLADRADAPILLIHGVDDTVVSIDQSRAMERALRNAGKPVELVTMKSEDHWLSREASRKAMLAASVDFVIKHNPPDPAPAAPAAAATAPGSSN